MLTEFKTDRLRYFVDEQGRRQGECREWYQNGTIYMICNYVDNLREGLCKRWCDDGEICYICFYKNGKAHGEYREWDDYGKVRLNFFCVDGRDIYFDEIPYPKTDEDLMYFKLKYDLPLISDTILADAIIAATKLYG